MSELNHNVRRLEDSEVEFLKSGSDKKEVEILIEVLIGNGITEFVCSPGSRNTPLLISVAGKDNIKITMVVDERTAAFVALGKCIVSRKPVALICTSGTAALNYAPALAEAYYSGYPLIAITADRPKEWIDQDDSQTIRQEGIFNNFIKRSFDIPTGRDDKDFCWYVNRIANEGMLCAKSDKPGPVHFNFRFSTPLGGIVKTYPESVRIIEEETTAPFMTKEAIYRLSSSAYDKRILIVAGFLPPSSNLQKSISSIMKFENVAVMAETISNLHLSGDNYSIDSTLCHLDKTTLESLRPDIVISLGGALVSRRLKEWLRSCPPDEHWVITQGEVLSDCFQSITKVIKTEPFAFIRQLAGSIKRLQSKQDKNSPSYSKIWQEIRRLCSELNRDFINNCGWSDLKAFSKIIPAIPTSWNLFISNGTSIRYDQIISHAPPHSTFCNRGVSGIDGSTSTAVGGSTAYKGMTLLITGDTSFAYDLGGLGCRLADKNFRLIVIRNGGGGIFRFISSTSSLPMREQCFCADPNPPCQGLANAYGWKYLSADSEASLSEALKLFLRNCESPILLEVFTPQEESAEILRQFFRNQRINPTSIFKHYYV